MYLQCQRLFHMLTDQPSTTIIINQTVCQYDQVSGTLCHRGACIDPDQRRSDWGGRTSSWDCQVCPLSIMMTIMMTNMTLVMMTVIVWMGTEFALKVKGRKITNGHDLHFILTWDCIIMGLHFQDKLQRLLSWDYMRLLLWDYISGQVTKTTACRADFILESMQLRTSFERWHNNLNLNWTKTNIVTSVAGEGCFQGGGSGQKRCV